MDSLGVRIPEHWFSKIVEELGRAFVTTSVNLAGEPFMKEMDELKEEIKNKVDYIIYKGILDGALSKN